LGAPALFGGLRMAKSQNPPDGGKLPQANEMGVRKALSLTDIVRMRCGNGEVVPDDDQARESWPVLWALLTQRYPDAEHVLEPARVSIQMGLGCWIVSLSHPDLKIRLETTTPTLAQAFQAWETFATDPRTQWKGWGKGEVTLRKRKNKKL